MLGLILSATAELRVIWASLRYCKWMSSCAKAGRGDGTPPGNIYFLFFYLALFQLFLLLIDFYSWHAAISECRDVNKNRLLN